jgi:hypothetical protein
VGKFVSLPAHSLYTLCGTSSIVFDIFYHKLWTISKDYQVAWLVYTEACLQNSSAGKIPKILKENGIFFSAY